jgi:hypothetical protein
MKTAPFLAAALCASAAAASANPLVHRAPATELAGWTVEVSSRLSPQGGNTYGPGHLLDGPETAWVEGAAGDGSGEWIRFTQAAELGAATFRTIRVWNGYQKSEKAFRENGRVRELEVSWQGGSERVSLADRRGEQAVRLSRPITTPWVRFAILSAYPGGKGSDTAISGLWPDLEELGRGGETAEAGTPAAASPREAAALLIGRWEGGRHTVEYRADGTFSLDPDPGEWFPLGTWEIEGGFLVERWKDDGKTERSQILSLGRTELIIRSGAGKEYTLRRVD